MLWFNTIYIILHGDYRFFQKERGINHWNSDKSLFHVWAYLLYMIRHDTPSLLFNDFQIVHVQVFTKVRPVYSDADWVIIAWIYLKHWLGNCMTLSISGGSILTELQTHPANMNHTGETQTTYSSNLTDAARWCRPTILGPMSLQVPAFKPRLPNHPEREPFTSTAHTSAIIYNVHTITLVVMDFILLPLFTTCHIQVSLCLSSKYVQTSPSLSTTFCIAGFVLCISRPSGLSNPVALQVSYSFIIETSVRSFVVIYNKFPLRIFASTLNLGSVF